MIETRIDAGVMTLRMQRPDKKNALTHTMYTQLAEGLLQADQDDAIRVVWIAGEGKDFTSGNDLKDFAETPPSGPESPVMQFLLALSGCRKPIVASVSGVAIGIGTSMLLHCDLVYCDDSAFFQLPFVPLGLCPEGGTSALLPLRLGHARASELLLLGTPFGAAEALQGGIVSGVVEAEQLHRHTEQKVLQLAQLSAESVQMAKALMKRHMPVEMEPVLLHEGEKFIERLQSDEAQAAFKAFLKK